MYSISKVDSDNFVDQSGGPTFNSIINTAHSTDEQKQPQEDGNRNLLVTGLNTSMVETELMELFRPFGTVSRVKVTRDVHTGKSRGQGFVLFEQMDSAAAAINALDGTTNSDGETLNVYYSTCKPNDAAVPPSKTLFVRNIPKDTPLHVVQYFFSQVAFVRHCTKHEDKAVGRNGLSIVVRLKFDKKVKAENIMEHVQKMTANPFSAYHTAPGAAPLLIAKYAQVFTDLERQLYREAIAAKRISNPSLGAVSGTTATGIGISNRNTNTFLRSLDSGSRVTPEVNTTTAGGLLMPPLYNPPQPPANSTPPLYTNAILQPPPSYLPPTTASATITTTAAGHHHHHMLPMSMMPVDPPAYTEA